MTDQTAHDVTNEERMLARKWAKSIESRTETWTACTRAAVRVILDAVPAPTPPTLADMTDDERAACRWLQCDYAGETSDATSPGVIGYFDHGGRRAVILTAKCGIVRRDYDRVTPRPDLPRLEWPGTGQDGEEATKVDYVSVAGGRTAYGPWTVARLRKKPDTVPLNTLAVGIVWDDADALTRACEETGRDQITATDRDGDVYVWDANQYDWRDLHPIPNYAPYTIIHTGREADQ